MARIEITDLPVQTDLNRQEQKDVVGGSWSWSTQSPTLVSGAGVGGGPHVRGTTVDPSDPSAGTQNGIIAILIGM